MSKILNNPYIAVLKLVRIENLIMIALTQYFLRYFVLQKVLSDHDLNLFVNDRFFGVLVFSTILIAAAGYVINDYFDVKTDLINHPDTVVLDKVIKRRIAIIMHLTFTIAGLLLGVWCSLKAGYLRLSIFHFSAAALLWFYSTNLKKSLLIGNIVVSILTAAVSFIPLVYEIGLMEKLIPDFNAIHSIAILKSFKVILIFSIFAFLTSLAREILKDIEDFEGDKQTGGATLPIKWGKPFAKMTAFFILLIVTILLMFVVYNTFKANRIIMSIQIIYISTLLISPLLLLEFLLIKAKSSLQFKRLSLLLKVIMLFGLSFSIIYFYY
ncbi:MAG: geranylgeranylglycerol-phosphate geranylgeranyltransferase [Sphingobacteriaceae bacterium]|nr:geranylgeranylglycerol-phosphate geranylgeranyltransferase [Sphingobacteriaceae bacterium]